jgi:hypothetical protein
LDKGTTTVKADGGMMIATKGSEYSLSNGDNAGVAGGVKSSTFMKESTWILYSFDVKMDGQNACRLTDKKFQNHENTADLAGNLQIPVGVPPELQAIADCCNKSVDCLPPDSGKKCTARGTQKHSCCQDAINREKAKGNWDNVTPEEYHPPTKTMDASRLDVQIRAGATGQGATTHIFDFKFNCTKKPAMSAAQRRKYRKRFTGAKIDIVGSRGLPNNASKAKKAAACPGAQARSSC